jgi:lactobin A/cerein 7B family class IIb bacteriocin
MMAIMNDEVVEPSVPFRAAATFSAAHHRPRDLDERELDEVAGGVANLVTGGIGAGIGGLAAGVHYATSTLGTGGFRWGTFASVSLTTAASGFMIGTGVGLVGASLMGVARGAHVLGTSMIGAGVSLEAASGVSGQSGGSERE